ncbi:myc box-dependent-interacting protein 1 isoform X4 [Eurytemora carolleeae]|uniref:myc box-dependent-interacting protein 1 isoform X4 n=1 Tax=Eurytemora carolleeae TaxID=1294199 RepID=UPI000C76C603|nr:myc box-dependent-interacting protein 1 isoform X4 [Eurytemora carolleeae]|eukprot:XP_023345558.1 myc box-dependent-interacting protein 1-like isoform X4 [Eurytemora affinis]
MQNLGKADKTTDEIFEDHLLNFNTQQVNATRLHKDINNYLRCIRAMQTANKNLMDTLSEIYEKEWVGQDMLYVQAQNNEMLWADLAHKLADQVVTPLNTYQAQFPEMRKKIDKRGRKLIDFDAERHTVQQMQNNPNRNEAKFIRAKEQMENAKRTYEVLNSELHDELPALYDSRILFLVTNMQTLFAAEEVFHSETSKVYSELEAVVDKLAKEVQKGTLPRRAYNRPLPIANHSAPVIQNSSSMNSPPKATNGGSHKYRGNSPTKDYEMVGMDRDDNYHSSSHVEYNGNGNGNRISRGQYDIPSGATTDNLPPGVLYKVKAAYKYQAEDVDELNFEVGEIIQVVEYEDPEEQQEEGWLMGVKESTGQKGLFPANFSRPI